MVAYWLGSFPRAERRLILVAALVLLPVFFLPVLPIWTMKLWAPQYPEGLTLTIYTNAIRGDLQKINTLNHYVGMHPITAADFREFTYLPQLLTLFGFMALLAALVNRRIIALLGWLAFTGFTIYMFRDYVQWLWHYGHDLDPRAAIKLEAFTPPVIGYQKMANFKVWSLPGPGTWLLGLAWLLGPIAIWLEWRERKSATAAVAAALLALGLFASPGRSAAEEIVVPARTGALAGALVRARDGDTVSLLPGIHEGPVRIDRAVILRGSPGAVLEGPGSGSVLEITAAAAAVQDLVIRKSGARVITADAGVRVLGATDVTLRGLTLENVLYGVYAERADRLRVERCRLQGRVHPMDEDGSGNGIHLWYAHDAVITGNSVESFADAVYLSFADRTEVMGNRLERNGRYGLHTMYCQGTRLTSNLFARNVAGCAIMFSNALEVVGNDMVSNRGPRTYGLLLRDCSGGTFRKNRLIDNTIAMFLDNSNRNRLIGNLFQDNGWGILLYSSCAGNVTAGNTFRNNDYPVALDMRHSDNRFDDGRSGNYWDENEAYDLDGDGLSDVPYSPVSAFAFLSKQYPDLTLLAKSPAVAAIAVAERVFPSLRPSEAVDEHPWTRPAAEAKVTGGASSARRTSWGSAVAFGGLLAVGIAGLA
ncbi:MAG TPA: nitrous oxide reductase family maturation protein NosD, partial [Candidatus Eisenbacteria bacterium]|nr:nitrous oxide reductase family maturation protein NosD [Candidatus Eisenbacteria bacterium]